MTNDLQIDPKLDLVFERSSNLTPEQIWKGWTDPQTLLKWFCPRPWKVTDCRIDLKIGGEFYTFMQGPAGEKMPNNGCFLEVIKNEKLVWTNLMTNAFRPNPESQMGFPFVATILLSKSSSGTNYKAIVKHGDEASRKKHEQMGFQEGWGAAFSQLIEVYEKK